MDEADGFSRKRITPSGARRNADLPEAVPLRRDGELHERGGVQPDRAVEVPERLVEVAQLTWKIAS